MAFIGPKTRRIREEVEVLQLKDIETQFLLVL